MKCEFHPAGHFLLTPETDAEEAFIEFAHGFNFSSVRREVYGEDFQDIPEGKPRAQLSLFIDKRRPPALVLRLEEQ